MIRLFLVVVFEIGNRCVFSVSVDSSQYVCVVGEGGGGGGGDVKGARAKISHSMVRSTSLSASKLMRLHVLVMNVRQEALT